MKTIAVMVGIIVFGLLTFTWGVWKDILPEGVRGPIFNLGVGLAGGSIVTIGLLCFFWIRRP